MTEMREEELLVRLRTLGAADEQRAPSPAVRARVMSAWDARQDALRTPRHLSFHVWLPVAASLTIVVGLMIGSLHDGPAPARNATSLVAVDQNDVNQPMLNVPDATVLPRFDHGELVQVDIPSPAGAIHAEVLIGQDGLARAIRVIQ